MDDAFELPVNFGGKELLLPAKLVQYGYIYSIELDISGIVVSFERDEERNWRAIIDPAELGNNKSINSGFLQAIAGSIQDAP